MRVSFDQNLLTSIFLYAEYRTAQEARAFQTLTTRLFPTADSSLPPGWQGYSSPLKGWIYDSGVSGALVINSVSGGGFSAPLTRASGIHFDYSNGRVILPITIVPTQPLTGTASVTEVNHYIPSETEDQLLTQNKMFVNPRAVYPLTASGAPPQVYVTPAVFVNPLHTKNAPYELGGTVDTKTSVSLTLIMEDPAQLNTMLGLWRDSRYQYIPLVPAIDDPLDGWGDLKGGSGYNYLAYVARYGNPSNLIFVEDVYTARISDRVRVNPNQWIGIVDLETSYVRNPGPGI